MCVGSAEAKAREIVQQPAQAWMVMHVNHATIASCIMHSHRIKTQHRIASYQRTQHGIASKDTASSHRIASHRRTSHRIASNDTSSHHIEGQGIASHRIASKDMASHRIALHRRHSIASHRTWHRITSKVASHRIISKDTELHRIASHRIAPHSDIACWNVHLACRLAPQNSGGYAVLDDVLMC